MGFHDLLDHHYLNEEVVDGLPGVVEPLEIDKPAGRLVDGPGDGDLDAKAVTVQARALVARRHLGQPVRRLETKLVHEPYVHGSRAASSSRRRAMYIVLSKQPRKVDRNKSKRYRAKLKAKDKARRKRVYNNEA